MKRQNRQKFGTTRPETDAGLTLIFLNNMLNIWPWMLLSCSVSSAGSKLFSFASRTKPQTGRAPPTPIKTFGLKPQKSWKVRSWFYEYWPNQIQLNWKGARTEGSQQLLARNYLKASFGFGPSGNNCSLGFRFGAV